LLHDQLSEANTKLQETLVNNGRLTEQNSEQIGKWSQLEQELTQTKIELAASLERSQSKQVTEQDIKEQALRDGQRELVLKQELHTNTLELQTLQADAAATQIHLEQTATHSAEQAIQISALTLALEQTKQLQVGSTATAEQKLAELESEMALCSGVVCDKETKLASCRAELTDSDSQLVEYAQYKASVEQQLATVKTEIAKFGAAVAYMLRAKDYELEDFHNLLNLEQTMNDDTTVTHNELLENANDEVRRAACKHAD